jgi:hypothetical protein
MFILQYHIFPLLAADNLFLFIPCAFFPPLATVAALSITVQCILLPSASVLGGGDRTRARYYHLQASEKLEIHESSGMNNSPPLGNSSVKCNSQDLMYAEEHAASIKKKIKKLTWKRDVNKKLMWFEEGKTFQIIHKDIKRPSKSRELVPF